MNIFQQVTSLNLPSGEYVVFGAGPLAAHGIRETADVDFFVTSELYSGLKAAGWKEKGACAGSVHLSHGIFEADDTWHYGAYNPTPEEIIAAADNINGVPFAPLAEVLKWKQAFRRPKDVADVVLIEQYLGIRH